MRKNFLNIFPFFQIKFEILNLFSQLPLAKMTRGCCVANKTIFLLIPQGSPAIYSAYKHLQLGETKRGGRLDFLMSEK